MDFVFDGLSKEEVTEIIKKVDLRTFTGSFRNNSQGTELRYVDGVCVYFKHNGKIDEWVEVLGVDLK